MDAKAQVNIQNKAGNTALHLAYLRREAKLIKLLKSYGADENIPNNKGQFPEEMSNLELNDVLNELY